MGRAEDHEGKDCGILKSITIRVMQEMLTFLAGVSLVKGHLAW
jgi:hypothetical protein